MWESPCRAEWSFPGMAPSAFLMPQPTGALKYQIHVWEKKIELRVADAAIHNGSHTAEVNCCHARSRCGPILMQKWSV